MGYIGPNYKIPSEITNKVLSTEELVEQLMYSSYNKNIIINADFHVDQRGWAGIVQDTTKSWRPVDCWAIGVSKDTAVTVNNTAESLDLSNEYLSGQLPSRYGLKITCQNSATGSQAVSTYLIQRNEKWDFCSGKKVTLSFYAKADSGCDIIVALASTAALDSGTFSNYPLYVKQRIGTQWKRYSFTFNMKDLSEVGLSAADRPRFMAISFSPVNVNSGSPVGDVNSVGIPISFTCVQLEEGDLTDYSSYRTESEEIIKCYRYLYVTRQRVELLPSTQDTVPVNRIYNIQFPVPMRDSPSCSGIVINSSTSDTADAYWSNIRATGATVFTNNSALAFTAVQTVSSDKLVFSCEF